MKAPKVTKAEISQTIDLEKDLGIDLSEDEGLKQAIGQAIIDKIIERTNQGKGIEFSGDTARTVKLKSPYSDKYADSLKFKAAGKDQNDVNMRLTGDMLASVDVLSVGINTITIGIADDKEKLKAFNHITGDTVPKRPWFGIGKQELLEIKRDFKEDIAEAVKAAGVYAAGRSGILKAVVSMSKNEQGLVKPKSVKKTLAQMAVTRNKRR